MGVDHDRSVVEVFWRPGCGFCSSMRRGLAGAGVDATWRNIWEDPAAAEFVRSVAGGNETVPTVRIGGEVMVAPRPREVIDRLLVADPALVADGRAWPPLRVAQWITLAVVLFVASAVGRAGHDALAIVIDGAAIATFLGFRRVRSRRTSRPMLGEHDRAGQGS